MDFSVAVLFTYYSRFKQTDWVSLYPKKKRLASLSVILLTFLFNCAWILQLIDITRPLYNKMLHAFIGDCLTVKQNIPDLHTTYGFCCETLHQLVLV